MFKHEYGKSTICFILLLCGLCLQSIRANENNSIVVFGASGRIGQVIVVEALERGHKVIGVSRNPENLQIKHENFISAKGDLTSVEDIKQFAKTASTFVISISAKAPDNLPENSLLVKVTENVHSALENMKNRPYIVQVGGANLMYGSSYEEVKKNMQDAPFVFEKGTDMHAVLFGHQISLDMYRAGGLEWTVAVPPMKILGIYGKLDKEMSRGDFRLSTTEALVDEEGKKSIYVRDFVIAIVDEIENKKFTGQVFHAAY